MFHSNEPPRTGLELGWKFFGIRVRVFPSFFIIAGLFAFVVMNNFGKLGGMLIPAILIDVGCIFVSLLFTFYVQSLVYRSYGLRSTILVREFGGGVYPEHQPDSALQRIVVAMASPASSWLLYAIIYYTNQWYHWSQINIYFSIAYFILWIITLVWGTLGLLPIYPYPMGQIIMEVLSLVTPRHGLKLTLIISIGVALAYVAYTIAVHMQQMKEIPLPLTEGLRLPANIIAAVFFGFTILTNYQMLVMLIRASRNSYRDEHVDDERAPWER